MRLSNFTHKSSQYMENTHFKEYIMIKHITFSSLNKKFLFFHLIREIEPNHFVSFSFKAYWEEEINMYWFSFLRTDLRKLCEFPYLSILLISTFTLYFWKVVINFSKACLNCCCLILKMLNFIAVKVLTHPKQIRLQLY